MDRRAAVGAGTRVVTAIGAGLVAVLLVLGGAGPALAVEAHGIRLDPVEPAVLGDGSVLRPALVPGATVTYGLQVHNTRAVDVEVLLYGADVAGVQVASGTDNVGVGAWIRPDEPRIALAAGETTVVEVHVTRPADDVDGGVGAVVVQLAEATRSELQLSTVERGALRIEVASDPRGDGLPVEVAGTRPAEGAFPRRLLVDLRVTNPGPDPAAPAASVVVDRPGREPLTVPVELGTVAPGATTTVSVPVEVPWGVLVARVSGETAQPGQTTASAPVRVVQAPPAALALLLVLALVLAQRLRARRRRPVELGRVPGHDDQTSDEVEDEEEEDDEVLGQ